MSAGEKKLVLHTLGPVFGFPGSASPFCTKLECFLRLHEFEFETDLGMKKGPKGKWPWVQMPGDGRSVGDSAQVMSELLKQFPEKRIEEPQVAPEVAGAVRAALRMLEEATYFAIVFFRWQDERGWAATSQAYFGQYNWLVRSVLIPYFGRRNVIAQLAAQGTGRHDRDTVAEMLRGDVEALSRVLGERDFFLGERMTDVDCTFFGFISGLLTPIEGPGQEAVLRHPNLLAYYDRVLQKLWPDLVETVSSEKMPRVKNE